MIKDKETLTLAMMEDVFNKVNFDNKYTTSELVPLLRERINMLIDVLNTKTNNGGLLTIAHDLSFYISQLENNVE